MEDEKVEARHLLVLSTLFLGQAVSQKPDFLFQLDLLASKSLGFSHQCWGQRCAFYSWCLAFLTQVLVGPTEDSSPYTCTVSTFPTEVSPQPVGCSFFQSVGISKQSLETLLKILFKNICIFLDLKQSRQEVISLGLCLYQKPL